MGPLLFWRLWLSVTYLLWIGLPLAGTYQNPQRQAGAASSIVYTLKHPLHTVKGTSNQVSSQLHMATDEKTLQQVLVTVPVRSFDSGNRARDRDMLKTTEEETYPNVHFKSSRITEQGTELSVTGQLTFHGVTREIQFTAQQQRRGGELVVDGGFTISLDEYNIKRPSLFGMKIKDDLHVNFHMVYPGEKAGT